MIYFGIDLIAFKFAVQNVLADAYDYGTDFDNIGNIDAKNPKNPKNTKKPKNTKNTENTENELGSTKTS